MPLWTQLLTFKILHPLSEWHHSLTNSESGSDDAVAARRTLNGASPYLEHAAICGVVASATVDHNGVWPAS